MRRVVPRVLAGESQQPPSVKARRSPEDRPTLPGGGPYRGPRRTSRGRFERRRDPCMSRRTSLPSRVTTVALSGTAVLALSASVLIGASGVSSAAPASPSDTSGAVSYAATKAAESAFQAAGTNADPVACQRPAPDNRVSTTIHCYTPNQIRAFYGLDPLTPQTTQGEGQTIVLVDSYGSPTAAADLGFFAQTFGGPAPNFDAVFPIGKPDYKDPKLPNGQGQGVGNSGPVAADGWAGEAS